MVMNRTKTKVKIMGLAICMALLGLGQVALAQQTPLNLLTGDESVKQLKEDAARYLQTGFDSLAINAYRSALDLEDRTKVPVGQRDADVPLNLGLIYINQGKLAEARDAFRRSVEADPQSFKARYQLGLAEMRLGNQAGAREQLTMLVGSTANTPEMKQHLQGLLATLDPVRAEEKVAPEGSPPAPLVAPPSEAAKLLPAKPPAPADASVKDPKPADPVEPASIPRLMNRVGD